MSTKPRQRMARAPISQLNINAAAIARAGISTENALRETARQSNLILVCYGENAILYRSMRGAFLSAWLEGPHGCYIGSGGAGFDDRIEWAN